MAAREAAPASQVDAGPVGMLVERAEVVAAPADEAPTGIDVPRGRGRRGRPGAYVARCGRGSMWVVAAGRDGDGPTSEMVRSRCGSWRCHRCRRILARRAYARLRLVADIRFGVTLTFDPSRYAGPQHAERALYTAWTALAREWRLWWRRLGGELNYYLAVEWHRSGWPHVHILLRDPPNIPRARGVRHASDLIEAWLRRRLERYGFGKVVDVRPIYDSAGAAAYVLADVAKTYQLRGDYSAGMRRIRCSRRWWTEAAAPPERPEVIGLRWVGAELSRALDWLSDSGGIITRERWEPRYDGDPDPGGGRR